MPGFHEVQFPTDISYGSSGGPGYRTEIVMVDSGAEERIARWSQARREYNVAYGIQAHEDLNSLRTFFLARRGAENGFRFKDWLDFTTAIDGVTAQSDLDEKPTRVTDGGVDGDGTETTFQCVKRYLSGAQTTTRTITKPVSTGFALSLNDIGQEQRSGTATSSHAGTQLTDTAATFLSWGVRAGNVITNTTDGSSCTVTTVDSETQITHSALSGGAEDDWDSGEAYTIDPGWSVNTTSGVITFTTAPTAGMLVKAGFEFDVPCRFGEGADLALQARIDDFSSGSVLSLPVIEVLSTTPVDEEFYYGGAWEYTISADVTITQLQGRAHIIEATVGSLNVNLPDMTGMPGGGPHFYILNKGATNTFSVNQFGGSPTVVALAAGEGAEFWYDNDNDIWYALKGA